MGTKPEQITAIHSDIMGDSNIPLLSLKQENLRQAVKGCSLIKLKMNLSEISSIAEINEKTAQNHRKEIQKYWSEKSIKPDADKDFIRRRIIELGIKEMFDSNEASIEVIFGVILGTYLKVDTDLLDRSKSLREVRTIGKYIIKIYRLICTYKHDKGIPVHSNNRSAKYILQKINKNNFSKLFIRSNDYIISKRSKRWKSEELLKIYVEKSVKELLNLLPKLTGRELIYESNNYPYMSPQNGVKITSSSIINNNIININTTNSNIINTTINNIANITDNIANIIDIKISDLKNFEDVNSVFNLLVRAVKITKTSIFVPIIHESSTDETLGRSYNVFSRIRSKERLRLGYISYDMNAALQSISLQLIKADEKDYPVLWKYTHDKEHKKKIRLKIAEALGLDVDEVKKKLTAFANGSASGINLHEYYKDFQKESDKLRRAVLQHINETEPDVLERAREQSKRELPEELDWSDTKSKETLRLIRDKASVFFFAWTWYERKVRQAMLTVLTDGIELHDAVYSKMDISANRVQDAIRDETGFNIIIEKEMPE